MAKISIFRFTFTSVNIKHETFSNHRCRITFNNEAFISLQIRTNQTKVNPSSEVLSLNLTVTQGVSIEIRFFTLPSFYPCGTIPLFKWLIPIDLLLCKKDIDISTVNSQLTIKSIPSEDKGKESIHKVISKRQFTRTFTLAYDVIVNGAELKDGMLVIDLEKIVPEEKKPKTIKIK